MTMYHQIKVGYKKLTNLVDIIQKQKPKTKQTYMHQLYEPLLWPWPWNSKTIFLHNTQIHGDVSITIPSLVTKDSKDCLDKH